MDAERKGVLLRKLDALRKKLARDEKILAEGGFRDANGDWVLAGERTRELISQHKAMILLAESELGSN
jgi:hypothetical protein